MSFVSKLIGKVSLFSILILGGLTTEAQTDSSEVLSFQQFMALVKAHHPVALQAEIKLEEGEASVLRSRGAFDPKLFTDVSQKYFDGSDYYSVIQGGLKLPTWFGIELITAYEQNRGIFLNPENNVPDVGLWHAGLSITLGKGLVIDQRRAELKKAELFVAQTKEERRLMINQLIYEAGQAYWKWFESYHVQQILQNGLLLAQQRFDAVRESALQGDRPFIDTLEAGIQVQNRQLALQEAQLDFANAGTLLSIYVWADGVIPLEIAGNAIPPQIASISIEDESQAWIDDLQSMIRSHPKLRLNDLKINALEVDRRLKQEQLKPDLKVKYAAINEPVNGNPVENYSSNNYTWGLEFSFPLFLRKARGDVKLTKLKIRDAQLNYSMQQATLGYEVQASINELRTTVQQAELYNRTVEDYRQLLSGEQQLFAAGESSLFLVNSRETSYLNTRVKSIQLLAKNRKAGLSAAYVLGLLN